MRRPNITQARLFASLVSELEPRTRRGFMASVTDLQSNVNWQALLSALEQFDTDAAIAALNISPAAWQEYSQTMAAAYAQAGSSTMAYIRQQGIGGIGVRFNMGNPRAEQWILENVANRIVGYNREQVEVARAVINRGYSAGEGPRTIALDLAGRVGRGGAREGGVLGLDGPRAERLNIVSQGMRTAEGVQGLVTKGRNGELRLNYKVNPATGERILSAYRKGEAVPQAQRNLSERQYQNALLKQRADTIAQTETAGAVMSSRDEAWTQLAESEGLDREAVRKTWRHRRGGDGREQHIAMAGVTVQGLDTPFEMPDGTRMLYPHDPAGGAKHNVFCACSAEYSLVREVD